MASPWRSKTSSMWPGWSRPPGLDPSLTNGPPKTRPPSPGFARRGRSSSARSPPPNSPSSTRPTRAIRGISSTPPEAPPVGRRPPWQPGWCHWRSVRRPRGQRCGRPRTAVSSASNPPTAGSAAGAWSPSPGSSTMSASSAVPWPTPARREPLPAGRALREHLVHRARPRRRRAAARRPRAGSAAHPLRVHRR